MEYFAGLDVSMAETQICIASDALTIRLISPSIATTAASTAARAATRPSWQQTGRGYHRSPGELG